MQPIENWNDLLCSLRGADDYFLLESNLVSPAERLNYLFIDPVGEVVARGAGEVEAAFERIEEGVADGLYAAGFFLYELGYCFESVFAAPAPHPLPLLHVGLYRDPAIFDAGSGEWVAGGPPARLAPGGAKTSPKYAVSDLVISETRPAYERKIEAVKRFIEQGDTYQINYTVRLDFAFEGDPLGLYLLLRDRQKVPYAAIWRRGAMSVLSFSPELFFRISGDEIETRPMKGTVPRGADGREDDELAEFLRGDEKNRAENLMIVDLLRNDLGRVCAEGAVSVPHLFRIEKYETLYQMTSTVRGRLGPDVSLRRLFGSLFPSGSVTGAPKISSMSIIRELESRPRSIYTGAIGFIAPMRREAVFNVSIRTIMIDGGRGEIGIGGGIVYDSRPESEWREALLKANFLLTALPETPARDLSLIETILWTADGGFFLLRLHLERLQKSAKHFGIPCDPSAAERALGGAVADLPPGSPPQRVRMLVSTRGVISVERRPLDPLPPGVTPPRCTLSSKTVLSNNPFLHHKTTMRDFYNAEHAAYAAEGFFDVVFLNERGEATEGAISNVLVKSGGGLLTPPLSSGLLDGVFRRWLLETGEAAERVLYPRDLEEAETVFLCNSVRGLVRVEYETPDFMR